MEETTYKEFKEALSDARPVYEHCVDIHPYCDGTRTGIAFKDYQQVKIETSDGTIDGYITYTYSIEIQAKEE